MLVHLRCLVLGFETLERVEAAFGDRVEARFEEALYGASEAELLARLRALPPELDSVMIVGHNPGLEELALALAAEGAERARMQEKVSERGPRHDRPGRGRLERDQTG